MPMLILVFMIVSMVILVANIVRCYNLFCGGNKMEIALERDEIKVLQAYDYVRLGELKLSEIQEYVGLNDERFEDVVGRLWRTRLLEGSGSGEISEKGRYILSLIRKERANKIWTITAAIGSLIAATTGIIILVCG